MQETILQFGTGNFLRGFADDFIQQLNNKRLYAGQVVVVSPTDSATVEKINAKNGRYHLLLRGLADVLDMLEDLAAAGGLPPELLAPLVKTLGIALVSRLGTEICRDAGQGAMAAVLETAGAFGAVLVSLPLVRAAWELLRTLV